MSSKDSASDKLVASMRKTKTAKTTVGASATSATGDKTAKKKVVKKTVQRSRQTVDSDGAVKTAEASNSKARLVDLFQSGQRVWPD